MKYTTIKLSTKKKKKKKNSKPSGRAPDLVREGAPGLTFLKGSRSPVRTGPRLRPRGVSRDVWRDTYRLRPRGLGRTLCGTWLAPGDALKISSSNQSSLSSAVQVTGDELSSPILESHPARPHCWLKNIICLLSCHWD